MFTRISRYRQLPDVVTVDAAGGATVSKSLRPLEPLDGRFLHTVQDVDRLDHLAFKYYDQPRDWWRIADANPSYLAPDALLEGGPEVTLDIPVTFDGATPPWAALLRALLALPGIDHASLGLADRAAATLEIVRGPLAFGIAPTLTADLDASTRTQVLTSALDTALQAEGESLSTHLRIAKLDAVTWRIIDADGPLALTFLHFPADPLLNVHRGAFRFAWELTVIGQRSTMAVDDLLAVIEANGFTPGTVREIRRVGKPIVIPPRRA